MTTTTTTSRIVKLLNTGFHGTSNEHEARNAMRHARRLMERHNLDLAHESLDDCPTTNWDGDDDDDNGAWCVRGGIVHARIRNRKSGRR